MDSPITVCHANLRKIRHLLFLSSNRMKNNGTGNPKRYSLAFLGFLKIRCWRCEICVITFWLSPISMLRLRPSVLLQSLLVHTQDSQYSQCWFKLKSWFSFWVFLLQSSKKWGILHQAVQTLMERMVSFRSWTSWRLSGICWALQLVIAWPKAPTETRVTWSRLVTDPLGICYSLLWKIAQV